MAFTKCDGEEEDGKEKALKALTITKWMKAK